MSKQPSPKRTILQERVAARLEALRRSPRDVSLKAGLGPDAIRTILNGRSRSPRADTLQALAAELQCDVAYLLGQIDRPYANERLRRDDRGTVRGVDKMFAEYQVSADWVSNVFLWEDDRVLETNLFSLPDFLPGYQHVELVKDDHCKSVAPKGAALHVLSLIEGRHDIRDGDYVVVERQALGPDQEAIVQRSCRRYRQASSDLVLLESANPDWVSPAIRLFGPKLKAAYGEQVIHDGEAIRIDGLVLRAILPLAGPPIEVGLVDHPDPERIPNDAE